MNKQTGEIVEVVRMVSYRGKQIPARCQSNRCPTCVQINAKRKARAIYKARPTHTLRLSQVADDLPTITKQMERLRGQIRKVYPTFEWLWSVETNPQGTGNHVHAYCHVQDDTISPKVIESCWPHDSHIQRTPAKTTVNYYGYQFKMLADATKRDDYLRLNGTKQRQYIEHHSRNFFTNN